MSAWWAAAATVAVGYLAGSLSPAYFFGRWLKGIDIRTVGRGHAGASNVYLHVNRAAGVITALIDLAKGAAVIAASRYLLHAPLAAAYLGGFAAIAGHVFPFYLGFRGGRGAATATGILMLSLAWLVLPDPHNFVPELALMAFVVVSVVIITRNDYLLSLVALPLLTYFVLVRFYPRLEALVAVAIIAYNFTVSLVHHVREEGLSFSRQANPSFWSSILKLVLLTFLILAVQYPAESPFLAPLSAAVFFLYLDIVRLRDKNPDHRPPLKRLAHFLHLANGGAKLSAATLFFLGAGVTLFFFHRPLALAAVAFLIVGNVAEKVIEPLYGRKRFLAGSLEGTFGHFTACVILGYILHNYLDLTVGVILVGALTASLADSLPFRAFNKVIVPVASALAMLFFLP